jgi:hypothetical protein
METKNTPPKKTDTTTPRTGRTKKNPLRTTYIKKMAEQRGEKKEDTQARQISPTRVPIDELSLRANALESKKNNPR